MPEHDRVMCKLNDDGTTTVLIVRTVPTPAGPTNDRTLDADTMDIARRHAAAFMFPYVRDIRG